MATSKEKDAAQVPPTRAMGRESATGTALYEAERDDVPTGEDRGSTAEVDGEPGDKNDPAQFTSNGQIPHGMIGSPSGPVPASVLGLDLDATTEKLDEIRDQHEADVDAAKNGGKRLNEATVGRIGRAELVAIGLQRGYKMNLDAGTRSTRSAFLKFQDEDKALKSEEAGSSYERRKAAKSAAKKSARKSSRKSSGR